MVELLPKFEDADSYKRDNIISSKIRELKNSLCLFYIRRDTADMVMWVKGDSWTKLLTVSLSDTWKAYDLVSWMDDLILSVGNRKRSVYDLKEESLYREWSWSHLNGVVY